MRVMDASGVSFEIITVSDGSTDGSPFTLVGFPETVVRRMKFANAGKGHALRAGLGQGRGRYLGFIDADGDISPEFLAPFVTIMRTEEPDIIIGSKRHPGSVVHYPPLRRLYSWGYQHLIHLLFRLKVKDTQVGIKLVDRHVIADVLPLLARAASLWTWSARAGSPARLHEDRRGAGPHRRAISAARSREGGVAPARRHAGPVLAVVGGEGAPIPGYRRAPFRLGFGYRPGGWFGARRGLSPDPDGVVQHVRVGAVARRGRQEAAALTGCTHCLS